MKTPHALVAAMLALSLNACSSAVPSTSPESTAQSTATTADSLSVDLSILNTAGEPEAIGSVQLTDSPYGLVLTPQLHGLPAGLHGFHVHANPSCDNAEQNGKLVAGLAAGGHYDPDNSGQHGTPWGNGHKGDLPALYVNEHGHASQPVLAPRLTVTDVRGRSLMVHAGGDNHADHPAPLGGGGARIACGVIE